jgi:hypothetical protein
MLGLTSQNRRSTMATCDVCGNDYDKAFQISRGSASMTFDSFECAILAMAPTCSYCGCKIVCDGIEVGSDTYCCANCADHCGGTRDRV